VKVVLPIRSSEELEALDWLMGASVEGSKSVDDLYQEPIPGERTRMLGVLQDHQWTHPALTNRCQTIGESDLAVHDAIRYLAAIVGNSYEASCTRGREQLPDSTMNHLPTDHVFERGFDPFQDGFQVMGPSSARPFAPFDQWIEILPTDRIVAVGVRYDPTTDIQA
jgi:hypothetical protein